MDKQNQNYESVLHMDHLVFDELSFTRINFGSVNSKTDFQFKVGIAKKNQSENVSADNINRESYRVTLRVKAIRKDEFEARVRLSGFFSIDKNTENKDLLLRQNGVAILFPYVRSAFTLLTTQPETQPIMMPIMNIAEMMNDAEEIDPSEDQETNLTE